MIALFDSSINNISLYFKNIFAVGEIDEFSVTEESSSTAEYSSVVQQVVKHYNLDVIII